MAIRELNAGRFQVDIYPSGQKGKRKRVNFRGTLVEAIEFEKTLLSCYGGSASSHEFVKSLLPDWLKHCELENAESTVDNKKKALRHFVEVFGNIPISMLCSKDVDCYKKKRSDDGVKNRTINKELSYFASYIKFVKSRGNFPSQGFVINALPNASPPEPTILSVAEVSRMIEAIEDKYRCILMLYYDAGLRRNEALTLTVDSVDIENRTIMVFGKNQKEESVPIITDRLFEALLDAKQTATGDYLFINPATKKPYYSIRKAIIRAAKKAGIDGKRVYAHLLRHCFGCHALAAGVNIKALQKLMRHSSVVMTEYYAKITKLKEKAESERFRDYVERQTGHYTEIIGGLRFSTEKSEQIVSRTNGYEPYDDKFVQESLYLTPNGRWFLLCEGGARTKFSTEDDFGVRKFGRKIMSLSIEEAHEHLLRNHPDIYVDRFGGDIIDA